MKKWALSLLAAGAAGGLLAGASLPSAAMLPLINQSFLFGLAFLMLGCLSVVARSGFFTSFLRGFRQLKDLFFRKPRVLDSDLYSAGDPAFEKKKEALLRTGTSLLLASSFGILLFSLVLTCFYER